MHGYLATREKMQLEPATSRNRRDIGSVKPTERGVVACGVYLEGKRIADVQIDDAGKWSHEPDHVVWIGLYEPDPELLQRLQNQFGLHPLAIEDAGRAHQRPKIEQYGESLFIVAAPPKSLTARLRMARRICSWDADL